MPPTHMPSTTTPLRALYSIFVQPAISKSSKPISHTLRSQIPLPPLYTRSFNSAPARSARTVKTAPRAQKYDEEITARIIQVVDTSTHKLLEPQERSEVLAALDRRRYRLVQVSADEPDNPDFVPTCRLVDKKESYDAERKRKAQQKESKNLRAKEQSVKTLELNWAIDGNDLEHRLEKVRGFLEEGRKVEVVLASKKRGRKATSAECKGLLERLGEVAMGVEGAKEARAFDGVLGGFGSLVLQGKASVAPKGKEVRQEAKASAW